jgi:hypothetical protein
MEMDDRNGKKIEYRTRNRRTRNIELEDAENPPDPQGGIECTKIPSNPQGGIGGHKEHINSFYH